MRPRIYVVEEDLHYFEEEAVCNTICASVCFRGSALLLGGGSALLRGGGRLQYGLAQQYASEDPHYLVEEA
eukprot:3664460-Heterocapsa_arctica.AAC.1